MVEEDGTVELVINRIWTSKRLIAIFFPIVYFTHFVQSIFMVILTMSQHRFEEDEIRCLDTWDLVNETRTNWTEKQKIIIRSGSQFDLSQSVIIL